MSKPRTAIIVPARLASERFPRKLLQPVCGEPFIRHTARRLREIAPASIPVIFATDGDLALNSALEDTGFQVLSTDPALPSGTDRLAAANAQLKFDRVINVQADEPLVNDEQITALIDLLEAGWAMATVASPFENAKDFADANKVKVVISNDGRALYFSRAAIPFDRATNGQPEASWFRNHSIKWHQGLYAYTADTLAHVASLPQSPLEKIERLEQLRALENGIAIGVRVVSQPTIGVDTQEDLAALEAQLAQV